MVVAYLHNGERARLCKRVEFFFKPRAYFIARSASVQYERLCFHFFILHRLLRKRKKGAEKSAPDQTANVRISANFALPLSAFCECECVESAMNHRLGNFDETAISSAMQSFLFHLNLHVQFRINCTTPTRNNKRNNLGCLSGVDPELRVPQTLVQSRYTIGTISIKITQNKLLVTRRRFGHSSIMV